ncbi:MAG: dockerin type I repeat-containing protein, partial [Oscillospiraceae bacterium]|nr:dockerin type I repeat-containing protein [Oscillospiraceae bacterium]
ESVMKKLQETQTYPDYFGGSGMTLIEYWLDDSGTEKVIVILEQQELVHIRLNPDGSQNAWDLLYPVRQNHAQSFDSAAVTRVYTLFNEIADGDVNADGTFRIADAVLLQKWLLDVPDAKLINWKAADFKKDNQINAVDFTLMKRELLNKQA